MKFKHPIIEITTVLFLLAVPLQAESFDGEAAKRFANLKIDDDVEAFALSYSSILRDHAITDEVRAELEAKYLVMIHRYLRIHSMPKGTPASNPRPPDGGMSKRPEDIKDPVLRAKYEKNLAENEALNQAKGKFRILTQEREFLVSYLVATIREKPEILKTVSGVFKQMAKNPEEEAELKAFLEHHAKR